VFAANPVLRPIFRLEKSPAGKPELLADGNGRRECYGYIRYPVRLAGRKTYRLRVRFRFVGFEDVKRHLVHGVFADSFNHGVFWYRVEDGWVIGEQRFAGPDEETLAEVRLIFRFSATGRVWWDRVSLQECEPIPARPVKIAVAWGAGDMTHWQRWLDGAGALRADIALMPECFDGNWEPVRAPSEPSPVWEIMARKARQWNMYVSGTTYVRRGELVFNSAPLFDRSGKLVGVYDKNMVYDPELDAGSTPGTGFPVFRTDFGRVGTLICYDSWFPETVQLLAQKGAELVLLPNAGYYAQLMHARAADNGVFLAVSSLNCPAGVWDPGGNLAGEERPDPTRWAPSAILDVHCDPVLRLELVTVDLSLKPSPHYWGGPMRSAPGGRRVRKTWMVPLESELAEEARRWWDH